MRAVVQRVTRACVRVSGEEISSIHHGLWVLVGVHQGDAPRDVEWMCRKLLALRIFPDADGKMNRSVLDVGGALLLVSQFTLCADTRRGTRPSFVHAMEPERAAQLFELLVSEVAKQAPVQTGKFGAHMEVEGVNDGPVTLWLDSRE